MAGRKNSVNPVNLLHGHSDASDRKQEYWYIYYKHLVCRQLSISRWHGAKLIMSFNHYLLKFSSSSNLISQIKWWNIHYLVLVHDMSIDKYKLIPETRYSLTPIFYLLNLMYGFRTFFRWGRMVSIDIIDFGREGS